MPTAVAVCLAESRGNTDAVSRTLDYGLWQIHQAAWPNLMTPAMVADGTWKDPQTNAGWAYHIWKALGWKMWATYNHGTYLSFMDRAIAATEGGHVMSKADLVLFYSHALLNQKYQLGNEPWYNIAGEPDPDPLASDCSGFMIGLWRRSRVLFRNTAGASVDYVKFFGTARPTAHVMYRHATPIAAPTTFGDLGFHVNSSGIAKHVWMYEPHPGNPTATMESGDGTGQVAEHNIAWQNAHPKGYRVAWGRVPHDMGALTLSGTPTLPDWPVMQYGSKSDYVRELKSILKRLGFGALTLTWSTLGRSFGSGTRAAVKAFQAQAGMSQTGVVDAATIGAMQQMLLTK